MEKLPTPSASELLSELQRLNKIGIINDEEYIVLRKILRNSSSGNDTYRQVQSLFDHQSKIIPADSKPEKRSLPSAQRSLNQAEKLYSMSEAINELNLKLTISNGFDHSRKLLCCPACRLTECT